MNQTTQPTPNQFQPQAAPQPQISEERIDQILLELEKRFVRAKVDKEKIYLYAQARMMDHYYHGRHQLVPKTNTRGEIIDFTPVSVNALNMLAKGTGQQEDDEDELNQWIVNDFRSDVRKFIAVLGTKAPNMTGRPRWASDPDGINRARVGSETSHALHSEWTLDQKMPQIVEGIALRGPVFYHTPWVVDAERLGSTEIETFAPQQIKLEDDYYECRICGGASPVTVTNCTECGAELSPAELVEGPSETLEMPTGQTQKYPNGTVELNIYSALEVTTLFYIESVKDAPWLVLDREKDPAWIVEKLDPKLEKLKQEFASGSLVVSEQDNTMTQGQTARTLDGNPYGPGRNDNWTLSEVFLRPMMYHYVSRCCGEYAAEGEAEAIIKTLKERYPRGLKIARVGKHILSKANVSIDDEWAVTKSDTGKYLWDDPYFADYLQIQDMMNDAWSLEVALRMRAFSVTYFDPQRLHPDSVNRRILPGEHVPMVGTGIGNISDALYKSTPTDIEPESHAYIMTLRDIARELVGLMPAVFGGDDPTQTAEQARRKLNQALMVLAVVWNNIRTGLTKATYNAVLQLARYSGGTIVSSGGSPETSSVRELPALGEVLKGGWFLESDQAIPMNWSQLKDWVMGLMNAPADSPFGSAIGAYDPSNLEKINEGVGLPGWKIPKLNAYRKFMTVIRQLLSESPIPGGVDPVTGDQIFTSSIPYDSFLYDADLVVSAVREWIYDESNAEFEGTPGYDNLLYYARAAQASMAPPPVDATGAPAPPPVEPQPPALPPGPEALAASPSPFEAPDASLDELEGIPEVLPDQTALAAGAGL